MAKDTEDIVLNIDVKYEDAINGIAMYNEKLIALKEHQDELKESLKDGSLSQKDYVKEMAAAKAVTDQHKASVKMLEKEIKNNIKAEQAQGESLNALRAKLSNLNKEYSNMTAAEREAAKEKGGLQEQIIGITDKLNAEEQALKQFYRNVGNYAQTGKELKSELKDLKNEMLGLAEAGMKNTEEYRNLQVEAQKLDAIIKGKNQTVIQITNTMSGLTGAYGIYKSAAAAANIETADLDKTMAKLHIVIAAITSWQALNKMLTTTTLGMKIYNASTVAATGIMKALGVANIATSNTLKILRAALIATGIGALIVAVGLLVSNLENLIGLFSKSAKAAKEAESANADYERQAQKTALAISDITNKRQLEIDTLNNKSREQILQMQKNGATEEQINKKKAENEKALRSLQIKLSEDIIEQKNEEIKTAAYALAKAKENFKAQKEGSKDYKEAADKVAELTANVLNLEAALLKEEQAIRNNTLANKEVAQKMADDNKKAAQDRAKESAAAAKEARQKEIEILRKAQDTAIALIKDNQQKEIEQTNLTYSRQIEDLKKRLDTEKNLTVAAKKAINETIANLQEQQNVQLAELNKKYSDEELNRQIEIENKRIDLMLAVAKKGSEDELELQQAKLVNEMDVEIKAMEEKIRLNEKYYDELALLQHGKGDSEDEIDGEVLIQQEIAEQKLLIEQKYQQEREKLQQDYDGKIRKRQQLALENDFKEKLLQLGENEQAKAQLILKNEMLLNEQLLNMDAETKAALYESDEAYTAAVLASKERIINAEKAVQDASRQTVQNQLSAISDFGNAMSGLMNEMGQDNEKFAAFQKLLALFNIGINTATAISGAISAATPGDPYTVGIRIAAAIAAAIAGTAAALSSAKGAKEPKAPKFAQGGTVTGLGSGTSDSIPAQLSNGESVLTALATQMFAPILSTLNQIGGGVPIQVVETSQQVLGEDMLARAMTKGFLTMPQPVVSVEDINNVNNRVTVSDSSIKL